MLTLGKKGSIARHGIGVLATMLVLAAVPAMAAQPDLSEEQIVTNLQGLSDNAPAIDVAVLAQEALANVGKPPGKASLPAWDKLSSYPQLTVEINFQYDSIAVVPDSYRALGLMADALHHPLLLGYKFLIVGHTDANGKADYNLKLSQRRADAIKEILSTTFAVPANRLFSVGVGEELPADAAHPADAINRRVQVINIGALK
jgi:outer membrane protein OmpA-like peptidoglycan-associated protein